MAAVRRYDVLDTPPDGAFDRITALAARLFDMPIAIVSIVDTDRIWFKSHFGLPDEQIDREPGLCASAILQPLPWVLPDARRDPRSLANPLVAQENGVGFYAGVPLTTHDGFNLGTLCVLDQQARRISEDDIATLADLASLVMDELELRREVRLTVELKDLLRRQAEDVAATLQRDLLPPMVPAVSGLEVVARYHVADRQQVGGDFYDVVAQDDGCALVVADACGKGVRAAALTGTARWALRTVITGRWSPARALQRLNEVLAGAQATPDRYCTVALAQLRRHEDRIEVVLALGGHPRPLVLRADGRVEPIGATSPIVGWSRAAAYVDQTAWLGAGDVLVLFTDGLIEATGGHPTSSDSALRALLAPLAGRSAAEVADRLDAAIGVGSVGEELLMDDAAFLVVRSTWGAA